MRTPLRFSAAVAFSGDRRQRWRQISVIGSAALAMTILMLCIGLLWAAWLTPVRAGAALGTLTVAQDSDLRGTSPEGAVASVVLRGTIVNGRQVPTVWTEPMPGHEEDPAAIPRGLSHLPGPGEAVLSPALVNGGITAEQLGWSPSDAGAGPDGAIGEAGLAAGSEPLIIVRPTAGTTLGGGGAISYVATFAASDPAAVHGGYALDPEVVDLDMMLPGVLVFLLIPGLILLISGSRARSTVRDDRLRFLHRLGVRPEVARAALGCETALLAAAGAVIAAAVHAALARYWTVIPGTDIRLFAGDLAVPRWGYLVSAVIVVAVAFGCGAMGRLEPRVPQRSQQVRSTLRCVALMIAVGVVVLSASPWMAGTGARAPLYTAGVVLVLVTLPLAVPVMTAQVSRMAARSARPRIWAASRRLHAAPQQLSRTSAVLAVLIVVVSFAMALWANSATVQREASPRPAGGPIAFGWRGADQEGLDAARAAFANSRDDVLLLRTFQHDDSEGPMPAVVDVDDCPATVMFLGGDPHTLCDPQQAGALADFMEEHVGLRTPDEGTRLLMPSTGGDGIIVARAQVSTVEVQRTLAQLPGLSVEPVDGDLTAPLPLVQWLHAGALAAFVILTIAIARENGDRAVEDAHRDAVHQRLGLSVEDSACISWMVHLVPTLVAGAAACACSLVIAYSGEVLAIARGEVLKLLVIAIFAVALPLVTVILTIPVRRAAGVAHRHGSAHRP